MKQKNVLEIVLFAFCIFIFSSCSDNENQDFNSVEFTKIGQGTLSGSGKENIIKSNLVITNKTDWQNLLDKMDTVNEVTPGFSETSIDFEHYQIIAVFLDIKTSGWDVEINEINGNKDVIVVSAKETEYVSTVMTQPFSIVKLSKTNKKISFWNELIYSN